MDKVRVAVIGVGFWGRNHARVFSELEGAELVAVCDIDVKRAQDIASRYGCAWYRDYVELLQKERPDAVTICTPTITHAKIAIDCIRRRVDVLVEKPMAASIEEAMMIVKEAKKESVKVMVGFIERFNPGVIKVKELIEKGRIGNVVLIFAKRVSRWPIRVGDIGVVKDLAIHDIDVIRYITESEPLEVYAITGSLRHKFEDYADILIRLENGATAFIEANWLTPRKVRTLQVTGGEGIITLDYITQEITIEDDKGLYKPHTVWSEPLKIELRHFIDAVSGKAELAVDEIDGLKALLIAEAALESSARRSPIRLNLRKLRL